MAANGVSRKNPSNQSKYSVENERLYFWFNSEAPVFCAALFKLDVCFLIRNDNKVMDKIVPKRNSLERVDVFFKNSHKKPTSYAAIAPIGGSNYLLLPNEFDRSFNIMFKHGNKVFSREKPIIYTFANPGNTSIKLDKPPVGRKVHPIAVTVDNKVYVLSRRRFCQYVLPEPSFEAYDPGTNSWEPLSPPWFNLNNTPLPSPDSNEKWESPGYAVFNDFIIVNFRNTQDVNKFYIYSYNTRLDEWKPVCCPTDPVAVYADGSLFDDGSSSNKQDDYFDDDDDEIDKITAADYLVWDGEALVVKNYIHAFVKDFDTIVSYKCLASKEKGCDITTLSLDGSIVIERCVFPEHWKPLTGGSSDSSGAVYKIRDGLICLVQTIYPGSMIGYEKQPVRLTTFRLDENGRICSRLQSLDLSMPGDDTFSFSTISSCFILPPKMASKRDHEEEPIPKKHELPYKGADAALVSDVAMMKIA